MMPDTNFEKSLNELELIVQKLENGEDGLDKTVDLYEKGVKLAAKCNKMLDDAEQKIKILSKTSNGLEEIPFNTDGE